MLPQSNGQLTSINADGPSDDWDQAAGAGTSKWGGSEPVYILTKIRTVYSESAGALVKFSEISLLIDDTLADDDGTRIVLQTGDILTFCDQYGREFTRRVMDDTSPNMPQVPTGMTYRRLHLEPQRLEL